MACPYSIHQYVVYINNIGTKSTFQTLYCDSGCTDTTSWYNGFNRDCLYYAEKICQNGDARPGMDYSLGSKYNYPEKNCCVCGKDKIKGKVNPI